MTSLLEVLAVIVLIGFIMVLAFPSFYLAEEKSELLHLGRLIKVDLEQAAEEALLNHSEMVVAFAPNGYHFILGDVNVDRQFNRIKFAVAEEKDKGPGAEIDQGAKTDDSKDTEEGTVVQSKTAGGETSGQSKSSEGEGVDGATDAGGDLAGSEVKFSPDGGCSGLSLAWESPHFTGNLSVDSKGTVEWNYAKK